MTLATMSRALLPSSRRPVGAPLGSQPPVGAPFGSAVAAPLVGVLLALSSFAAAVVPPCDPADVRLVPDRGHSVSFSKTLPIIAVFPTDPGIWYSVTFGPGAGTYYLEMHQNHAMPIRLRSMCAAVPAVAYGEITLRFDVNAVNGEGVCSVGSSATVLPKSWEDPKPDPYRSEIHHPIPPPVGPPLLEPSPAKQARLRAQLVAHVSGKRLLSATELDEIGAQMVEEPCEAYPPVFSPPAPAKPPTWEDVFAPQR
jgi:hypothetical protein